MPKENMVPIKVILHPVFRNNRLEVNYPDFNRIDSSIRKDMPWSHYIDKIGIGWHYDKVENIGLGNDTGACCTLVEKDFADAAVNLFPDVVQIMSESEWESFYDARSHVRDPEEFLDTETLQGILARIELEEKQAAPPPSQSILDRRAKALDPSDTTTPGIRKNENKTWQGLKGRVKITIHPDHAAPGS